MLMVMLNHRLYAAINGMPRNKYRLILRAEHLDIALVSLAEHIENNIKWLITQDRDYGNIECLIVIFEWRLPGDNSR